MRRFIFALVALLMTAHLHAAANIKFIGSPTWKLENGDCTFKMSGAIQNLSTVGQFSGSLKLVLWATPRIFPSAGYPISEYPLRPLGPLEKIDSFSGKAPANLPALTGSYHFTITVLEYTTNGWRTHDYRGTGQKLLEDGNFVTGDKWTLPNRRVIAPPAKFINGKRLVLTLKSTQEFSAIALDFQTRTNILATKLSRANVTIAGETDIAVRGYSVKPDSYYDRKVKVGKLFLNYAKAYGSSAPWNTSLTLYFHTKTTGVYKSVEVRPNGGGTTWGVFTYK